MSAIPGVSIDTSLNTLDHMDLISNNEKSFVDLVLANLSDTATPIDAIDAELICPVASCETSGLNEDETLVEQERIDSRVRRVQRSYRWYRYFGFGDVCSIY